MPRCLLTMVKVDLEVLSIPYKFALVGKFSKGRPKMEDLRNFFHSLDLKETASVDYWILDMYLLGWVLRWISTESGQEVFGKFLGCQ